MRRCLFALAALAGLVAVATVYAKVEADPNKDYPATPDVGPWMICAASYTGPEAPQLAKELVLDIRTHFDLPAFIFNRSDEERRKQKEERDQLRQRYPEADLGHLPHVRIQEQCVVLIGGYKDMDAARRALDDIKKLKPTSKRLMPILFGAAQEQSGKDKKETVAGTYVSPFLDGFVVPNPTVKREHVAEKKPDAFLKDLNAGESYSLLKCRRPWTLAVAYFQGAAVIQSQGTPTTFLDKVFSRSNGEQLAASAMNAHNLAEALRKYPLEAYVLHTRQYSIVTVGGFDRKDDPKMREVEEVLYNPTRTRFATEKALLLPQPVPYEVPQL